MPPRRKRGAQPGNTNALQHGFYSPAMRQAEISDLRTLLEDAGRLDDEIAMLRVMARRLAETSEKSIDAEDIVATTNAFGAAVTRLAGLMRVQQFLAGSSTNTAQAISAALSAVMKEMGIT